MSEKLTRMQRILRPIINYLVEKYFPTGSFYGNDGGIRIFERFDRQNEDVVGRAAAMMLIQRVHEAGSHRLESLVHRHTSNGILTGDLRVTVERISKEEKDG